VYVSNGKHIEVITLRAGLDLSKASFSLIRRRSLGQMLDTSCVASTVSRRPYRRYN